MAPQCYEIHFLPVFCISFLLVITHAAADHDYWGSERDKAKQDWLNHGGDLYNRRYASKETKISPETVSRLQLKWKFFAGKDISATPAIFDGNLYFPSWNGNIYAVRESDGSLVWKKNVEKLTGIKNGTGFIININWIVSRATPTIAGDGLLIFGIYGPAVVLAVRRLTGELVWSTLIDDNPNAFITMSGTYYKGSFYVGISSLEETLSISECCVFRGSFCKLDLKTGFIIWKTFMLPDNGGKTGGYAGAAIWGSSPSIDIHRNHIYVATGNLYSVPPHIRECQEKQNNQRVPSDSNDECVEPENHSDSILALDLDSGKIKWYHQLGGYDVWFAACFNVSTAGCPPGPYLDADFGEAPMMLSKRVNGVQQDIVVAVQKSGFAWALDRDNGSLVWVTEAGPGGLGGGGTLGAATDENNIYTNIVNLEGKNFTLKPSNNTTTSGGWVAMNARDGEIIWSVANPSNGTAFGPVSLANGVLFAGSSSKEGSVFAMDGKTGKILWSYETGATVYGGMSVSDGCIFLGNGYPVGLGSANQFTAGTSLFAFCLS
ncbi:Polyvinylalcohol dehydrogenase [Melia azedarach]|uniref:Polyvinylalcohol dehydrogenase n=1 Tax=Melia azedarach TaxID=155640 RepID=A0ACC1X6S5_MELAZ|nr:Polyvinylalcohol dehydrogenase [Melia azedarach]